MYMITRGNSMIPLVKLSEGYSIGIKKNNYVTVVCGSNGERLKPIKVWDKPFIFFGKEKLNAEFISKTELLYIKTINLDEKNKYSVHIVKYRLPDYVINNTELEYDVIRKIKPVTEELFHIEFDKYLSLDDISELCRDVCDGIFKEAIVGSIYKLQHKDELCYVL